MPELPDVEVYKKAADKAISSKVENIKVKDEKFVEVTKSNLGKFIKNQEITNIRRRGKYLFIEMENTYALVMHFGMTGFLNYVKKDSKVNSYTKCIIELNNNHKLFYVTKRKLGTVEISNDVEKYIDEKNLGPDALEISKVSFLSKLRESKAMVKSFFMDQSTLSGVGNIYADEILFQACVHPRQKAHQLSDEQGEELYKQMRRVLKTAIKKQADVSRMPDSFLLPKRKEGEKCPRGKGKVSKFKISGRAGYYCPDCQKKE